MIALLIALLILAVVFLATHTVAAQVASPPWPVIVALLVVLVIIAVAGDVRLGIG